MLIFVSFIACNHIFRFLNYFYSISALKHFYNVTAIPEDAFQAGLCRPSTTYEKVPF
jgi:hypothetical protein